MLDICENNNIVPIYLPTILQVVIFVRKNKIVLLKSIGIGNIYILIIYIETKIEKLPTISFKKLK